MLQCNQRLLISRSGPDTQLKEFSGEYTWKKNKAFILTLRKILKFFGKLWAFLIWRISPGLIQIGSLIKQPRRLRQIKPHFKKKHISAMMTIL